MQFGGINYVAVIVAGIAGWLVGAAWYMALGKAWMAALGKTKEELVGPTGKPSPAPFALAFLAGVLIAWGLAGIIGHLGPGQVTLWNGVVSGFFVWLCFVATTTAVNYAFGGRKLSLYLIDVGHWLALFLIQGAIIGLFGVR
jgi:hypothetical protein